MNLYISQKGKKKKEKAGKKKEKIIITVNAKLLIFFPKNFKYYTLWKIKRLSKGILFIK